MCADKATKFMVLVYFVCKTNIIFNVMSMIFTNSNPFCKFTDGCIECVPCLRAVKRRTFVYTPGNFSRLPTGSL